MITRIEREGEREGGRERERKREKEREREEGGYDIILQNRLILQNCVEMS